MPATAKPVPARARGPRRGVAAIVLAGGISTRMGVPKPLIPLAGRPLLVHSLDAVRASSVREIVVVLGASSDRVRRGLPLDGTRVVVNADYASGMSSSIRAGVRALGSDSDSFLVVLGDQPLVRPATLETLITVRRSTGARILVPVFDGVRGNPVLLDRSLSGEIEGLRGDVGCRSIVAGHADEVLEVPVDDPGILVDVDTPADVRRVEASLSGRNVP